MSRTICTYRRWQVCPNPIPVPLAGYRRGLSSTVLSSQLDLRIPSRRPVVEVIKRVASSKVPPPTSGPSTPSSASSAHQHQHDQDHDHDHNHGGLFHTHTHDHSKGAEQLIKAISSGHLDRGTRITLLGKSDLTLFPSVDGRFRSGE